MKLRLGMRKGEDKEATNLVLYDFPLYEFAV